MLNQWIEDCMVQRVSLHDGLVLDFEDYNELVISGRLRLTLPPVGPYPEEDVLIDPNHVEQHERPLLDLAGSVCTGAWCADNGTLHLRFSRGHRIQVDADPHAASWELYGKRHGYMACLPGGRVRTVRHDLPDEESMSTEIGSAAP
ncbi:hypothetical protein HZU40_00275 (plasmid) [Mycolicibacterium fluoranthenivorans]|uniref:Uncharacterized protein n=1 Tax=Mycolicibacterium fluoranthenivorans TaxID=258505 RepID=A0A7G8P6H3_9MYCO|nr:DUF6188 family protein [Mycolicibacterium fluoranthenivorans]QNJ89939.1 hypothetical protein HZU40_00275 [Mycolicibacterium fluoranthenivorans]